MWCRGVPGMASSKGAGIQVCGCLPHQVSRQILLRFRRGAALQRGSYVEQGFGPSMWCKMWLSV